MKASGFDVGLREVPRPASLLVRPNRSTVRALGLAFTLSGLATVLTAFAEPLGQVDGEDAVITYATPMDQRRAELRQALIGGADLPLATQERSRMSQAQRDALNRELRQAMKAAYEQRNAAK